MGPSAFHADVARLHQADLLAEARRAHKLRTADDHRETLLRRALRSLMHPRAKAQAEAGRSASALRTYIVAPTDW